MTEPKYRVFKNGKLDYRYCVKLARFWSDSGASSIKKLCDIAGENTVLAVNDVASWNDGIRRTLIGDYRPLPSSVAGQHFETNDVYAFISSGPGWTSFGAHIDFEHSIIFDLEGCGRDVLTWIEGADYGQRLNGASAFFGISFDWEEYVTTAERQVIRPGDVAVIRACQPHIFHANGPGMFLGLSTTGHQQGKLTKTVPVSSMIRGAAFAPRNDPSITRDFCKSWKGPRISIIHHPELDINNGTLSLFGRTIQIDTIEIEIISGCTSVSRDIFSDFASKYNATKKASLHMQKLAAKFVLLGAAVVD
jgi:hypothetical protein